MRSSSKWLAVVMLLAGPGAIVADEAPASDSEARGSAFELSDQDRVVLLGNTLLERDRHFGHFEAMLRSRFPGKTFSVRNLAWPGDTTTVQMRPLNFGSLQQHLSAQKPTVIFMSYGTNEAFDGPGELDEFLKGYEKILALAKKLKAKVVMISPIQRENLGPPLPDPQEHNRFLESYVKASKELAAKHGVQFLDLYHDKDLYAENDQEHLTNNGLHLTDRGYWKFTEAVAKQLGLPATNWKIEINAKGKVEKNTNAQVGKVDSAKGHVRFDITPQFFAHPQPNSNREDGNKSVPKNILVLKGLEPGTYQLNVEGQVLAEASAAQWAKGVALEKGPWTNQADKARVKIQSKEMLFFNRWRAHNAEYIFGRRSAKKGGNSGNPSFPEEMAQFDQLLGESDAQLSQMSKPATVSVEIAKTNQSKK